MIKDNKHRILLKEDLIINIKFFEPESIAKVILLNHLQNQLVDFIFNENKLISSRAIWVFWHCYELNENLLVQYEDVLIRNLNNKNLHNGVIRNTLRLFQKNTIPAKHESMMLDICFNYIKNPNEAIAVRAFAITITFNISKSYTELLNELKSVLILINHPEESAGIKVRIKNTLNQINKILLAEKYI